MPMPKRKAPSDPGFHPSIDQPHWAGDETSTGQGVMLDQGEDPARMNLFGGNEAREKGNTSRLFPSTRAAGPNDTYADLASKSEMLAAQIENVGNTKVPTQHWTKNAGRDVAVTNELGEMGKQAGGWYRHSYSPNVPPTIAVEPGYQTGSDATLIHEMGHAHHYGEVTAERERGNPTKRYADTRGFAPDPVKEGIADAYVDRYGGSLSPQRKMVERHESNARWAAAAAATTPGLEDMPPEPEAPEPDKWQHLSNRQFGYSTQFEANRDPRERGAWNDVDRTLYAGTRAHFSMTGEIPRYQSAPGETAVEGAATDATIHHLMTHSEHARSAWASTMGVETKNHPTVGGPDRPEEGLRSMTDIAADASRRHKDRQLLNAGQFVQESLFGEPEMARNQQGEVPRTRTEVRDSLGAREADWWTMGEKGIRD